MVIDINSTGTMGLILIAGTESLTGSIFLTLLLILLILFCFAIAFNIPLEFTLIIFLPLVFGYMSFYSEFVATGSILLIVLAVMVTKNFLFK